MSLNIDDGIEAFKFFLNFKNKVGVDKLSINLKKKENLVTKIKVINFFNYGYNKNQLLGEIFNKEFRLKLNENLKVFSFKILKTGVDIKINIAENSNSNLINGISKINILKNYFKIYFEYKNDNLKFINSKFKNKDLTIKF